MRTRFFPLTLLLLIVGCVSPAYAEMQVSSLEAGLFTRPDLTLAEGERVLVAGKETIAPARRIKAQLGAKFGVRFTLEGKGAAKPNRVTMLYLTPGIVEENGTRHDKYSVVKDLDVNAGSHDMAFQITETHEQVPGVWEFMVFEDDRLLLRERFELVAP